MKKFIFLLTVLCVFLFSTVNATNSQRNIDKEISITKMTMPAIIIMPGPSIMESALVKRPSISFFGSFWKFTFSTDGIMLFISHVIVYTILFFVIQKFFLN